MAQSALSPDAPLCYQMTSRPWSNLSSCRSRISATALRSSSKTGTGSSPPFGRHQPASCRASRAEIPVAHSDADDNACLGCMVDLGTDARMPLRAFFIAEPNSLPSFSVLLHRPLASIGRLCAPCFAQNPPHCPVSNPFALRLVAGVCGSK
jgi:hypothetical protein